MLAGAPKNDRTKEVDMSAAPAPAPATHARTHNLRGIRAMLVAVAVFAVMDMALKFLSGRYPAVQVASMRALGSLPLVLVWMVWRGALGGVMRVRWPLHAVRAALGIVMLVMFTIGVRTLSLAEAYTIFFVAPSIITVLSVLFLKERVSAQRWTAVAVGLLGVLIVLRPTGEGMLTMGGLAVLAAACCYAVTAILGSVIGRTDRVEHAVLWLLSLMAIGATALALPVWQPVRAEDAWLVATVALTGFVGQVAITMAFSHGEASSVSPFEYTALAWGVALDWLLWHTLPDRYTLIGAAVIIASGVYLVRHEHDQASRAAGEGAGEPCAVLPEAAPHVVVAEPKQGAVNTASSAAQAGRAASGDGQETPI
jgi:drug/metabolite transporter (DMT)-like permease